jgi:hypothetical protein
VIGGRLMFVVASLFVHILAVLIGRWPELRPRKAWTLLAACVLGWVLGCFVAIAALAGIHDHLHVVGHTQNLLAM